MISLSDFPRPTQDNGRGLHWSASPYHLSGHELDYWLDELKAMKIKWLKVLDDGGGSSLELCGRLVEIGIMPVVRLYIGNPGHVQTRNLEAIRRLLDVGAFYFETNNEPDLAIEWPDGKVPKNWLEIVVDNFIIDATEIINLGGFPAFPAMGVGTIVNPFELIIKRGRQDLFDNGAWLAIHNYVLNHPLDYPYDDVNQRGTALTQEEYDRDRWGWDQDKIETINRLRTEGASPGETIHEDATCWLAYSLWNEQLNAAFGHPVPIMSTEGGVVVGDRQDGRYPRNDAKRHQEVTLWVQDFLLNSAPTWYFTVFHWLIANNAMGQNRPGWETQAWYGGWWDKEFGLNGHLPTVDALKQTASGVRNDALADGVIRGLLHDHLGNVAADHRVRAVKDGYDVRETVTSAIGQFRLWGVPAGTYALSIDGTLGFPASNLTLPSHATLMQDLTLPGPISGVGGRVVDANGAPRAMQTVALYQGALFAGSTVTEGQGYYGFTSMVSGQYQLQVTGAVGGAQDVRLDGLQPATLDFTVPADQQFELRLITRRLLPRDENQGRHAFYGVVLDEAGSPIDGVKIEMSWTNAKHGTVFPTAITGSDAGKSLGYFEFIHTPGEFHLRLLDVPWAAQEADGLKTAGLPGQGADESVSYELVWQIVPTDGKPAQSVISGLLLGATDGLGITLRTSAALASTSFGAPPEEPSVLITQRIAASGQYRFDALPAGTYQIEADGVGVVVPDIVVDGTQSVTPDTADVRPDHQAVIKGTVNDPKGQPAPNVTVILLLSDEEVERAETDANGQFRFTALGAGSYKLRTLQPSAISSAIDVDGTSLYLIDVSLPEQKDTPEPMAHYLLFGPSGTPGNPANFRLAQGYILASGVVAGFNPDEAVCASRVTIVGDEQAVSSDVEEKLKQAGIEVTRLGGDSYAVGEALAQLLK